MCFNHAMSFLPVLNLLAFKKIYEMRCMLPHLTKKTSGLKKHL